MINVSPSDFYYTHKGLVKLLRLIEQAGNEGIPTRQLCEEAFKTRDSFCIELLNSAAEMGYVTRKTRSKSPAKGHALKVNRLTQSGKNLLYELEGLGEEVNE